jgi:hypothetical protein
MSAGFIIVIVVVGVAVLGAAARWWWCHRTPPALRGDWWPTFERDFRRWAASTAPQQDHRRRSSRRDPR